MDYGSRVQSFRLFAPHSNYLGSKLERETKDVQALGDDQGDEVIQM